MRKNSRLLIIVFFFLLLPLHLSAQNLTVTFIDVGQGDSILLETPIGHNILIDGGGTPAWRKHAYNIGALRIAPLLRKKQIKMLDKVILTHGHADHVEGLLDIISLYPVKEVIDTREGGGSADDEYVKFLELVKEKKIRYRVVKEGDVLELDPDLSVWVLNPPNKLSYNNANDNSLVLQVVYRQVSFLLAADIGQTAERRLVGRYGAAIHSQVLKIAHHGSKTSSCASFLDAVKPELAVISCGRNNTFGHPHPDVIKRLKRKKIQYLNTAYQGSITVTTNGENFQVKTEY